LHAVRAVSSVTGSALSCLCKCLQDYSDESLFVVGQALKGLLPTKSGGWEPLDFGPEPQQQQQQQQQRSGGSSSNSSNRGRSDGQQGQDTQQQQQQQQQQLVPGAAASSRDERSAISSSSSSSKDQPDFTTGSSWDTPPAAAAAAATAAAGNAGWPALDDTSPAAAQWLDNPDSWAAPAEAAAEAAAPAAVAAAGEEAEEEGSSSPNSNRRNGSPDGWSMVDPATQEMNAGVLDDLSNPEPQEPEQEAAGDQEQQQQ
jgi:hypothetical protein